MTRCPKCYRRVDADLLHIHICPAAERPQSRARASAPRAKVRYWRPSRAHRIPRAEYLASIAVSPEQKRAQANARQRAYKARKRAEKQAAAS